MTDYRALFVGLTTVDIQYYVEQFPEPNIKIKSDAPSIMVGGPSTNAAVAFSALNGEAYLAGLVGDNAFSRLIETDFLENNIVFTDLLPGEPVSPVIASVVTSLNGDRTIFTHHPTEINTEIQVYELFETINPQIVMLDGFYPEFSIECAQVAREKNIPVVVDCGSWKPQYEEMLKYTDFAICSADFYPPECSTSDDIFSYMNSLGIQFSAISRGDKNILYYENNSSRQIKIKKTKVIDTLGAGDFLHGAFCYYWLGTKDFETALSKASEIASFSCSFKGTRSWIKKWKAAN